MSRRDDIISVLIISALLLETLLICVNCNINSKYNQKYSVFFSKKFSWINKAVVVSRDKLKNYISARTKQTYSNQNNFYNIDFPISVFSSSDKLIDYREYIRQSIPHYFNGSNYKIITPLYYIAL